MFLRRPVYRLVLLPLLVAAAAPAPVRTSEEPLKEVKRLTDEAVKLRKDGNLPEAIKVWKRRLALVRELVGSEYTESVAGSLEILAELQEANRDLPAAVRTLKDAAEIREKMNPPGHWRAGDARRRVQRVERLAASTEAEQAELREIDTLMVQAFRLNNTDLKAAVALAEKALSIQKRLLGPEHWEVATTLSTIGFFYQSRENFTEAVSLYRAAVAIREKSLGEHPETARLYRALGNAYSLGGDFDRSLKAHQASLQFFSKTLGESDPDTLVAMDSVASLMGLYGDVGQALHLRERHLAAVQSRNPQDTVALARSLTVLGRSQSSAWDFAAARGTLERALRTMPDMRLKDPSLFGKCAHELALVYKALGDKSGSTKWDRTAYEALQAGLGADHLETVDARMWFIDSLAANGEIGQAAAIAEAALDRAKKAGHPAPLDVARLTLMVVRLPGASGDPTASRKRLEEAEAGLAAAGDVASWERAEVLREQAIQATRSGRVDEAAALLTRSRKASLVHMMRGLASLGESQQVSFAAFDRLVMSQAAALGVRGAATPALAIESAGWVVNGKGRAFEAMADRVRLLQAPDDAATAATYALWKQARDELAGLAYLPPTADESRHRQRLAAAAERERQLARAVTDAGRGTPAPPVWVAVSSVRERLAADEVLVEFVRFQDFDFGAGKWGTYRYAAWIVPPSGKGLVRVVDLGPAGPIELAIQELRNEMAGSQAAINKNERVAETAIKSRLKAVGDRVLSPLIEHLRPFNKWSLSPDAALWQAPWAALPGTEAEYVVEQRVVRYLTSGRELVAPQPARRSGPALLLADPDFNLEQPNGGRQPSGAAPEATAFRIELPAVPPLPGTAAEAVSILPYVKKLTAGDVRLLTGKEATEKALRLAQSPAVLVLSTHGFFLPGPKAPDHGGRLVLAGYDSLQPADNPWLRCGVLLAGCNKRGPSGPAANDGVFTGLQVLGGDFSGTRLVVLSACETAVGDVRGGEGIAALSQAFRLAGAGTVVASQWRVADDETARLIEEFFRQLTTGKRPAEALTEAQRIRIKTTRVRYGTAHPFFWAAFTASGARE